MRKINATVELHEHNISSLEIFLGTNFKLIDYKVLPETENLYEENPSFQKLIKEKKKIQREIDLFINKHN